MALPLLAVSGEEIVLALQRAGFRVLSATERAVVLTQSYRDVLVPLGPVGAEGLLQVLRAAGMPYATFIDLLEGVELEADPRQQSHVRRMRSWPDRD